MYNKVYITLLITILCLSTQNCKSEKETLIIGKWQRQTSINKFSMTFTDNNECIEIVEPKYKFYDNPKLNEPSVIKNKYSIDNDILCNGVEKYQIILLDKNDLIIKLIGYTYTEKEKRERYESLKKISEKDKVPIESFEAYWDMSKNLNEKWERVK